MSTTPFQSAPKVLSHQEHTAQLVFLININRIALIVIVAVRKLVAVTGIELAQKALHFYLTSIKRKIVCLEKIAMFKRTVDIALNAILLQQLRVY